MAVSGSPSEAPHLLKVAATAEPAHPDRRPPDFRHEFRQAPVCARASMVLRHFEDIKDKLGSDPLNTIIIDPPLQPLQRRAPRIGITGHAFSARAL